MNTLVIYDKFGGIVISLTGPNPGVIIVRATKWWKKEIEQRRKPKAKNERKPKAKNERKPIRYQPPHTEEAKNKIKRKARERSHLNESKVYEIKRKYLKGESITSLATQFSVSKTSIANILDGKTWNN